ncbi:MAG: group II intron maturase-specific domain-containing protein [Streptosporangiaceae bacterium]
MGLLRGVRARRPRPRRVPGPDAAGAGLSWIGGERIAISGVPSPQAVADLAGQGVTHVVNCRPRAPVWWFGDLAAERAAFGPGRVAHAPMQDHGRRQRPADWHLNRCSSADLSSLAREINPQVQGWINYYGAFYRSELCFLAWRINEHLVRWAMHKFKRFRGKYAKATAWLQKVYQYKPGVFAHWQLIAFT